MSYLEGLLKKNPDQDKLNYGVPQAEETPGNIKHIHGPFDRNQLIEVLL